MLSAVAMIASRVSEMFRVDRHQRASSGTFLGENDRGNAATHPSAARSGSQAVVEPGAVAALVEFDSAVQYYVVLDEVTPS